MGVDFVGGHQKRTVLVDPNMWHATATCSDELHTKKDLTISPNNFFFCKEYLLREV